VVHDLRLLQLLQEGERHPHLLLPLLDGAVDGPLDHLVPKVRHAELPHAPHRLLELPLHVVLLHERAHALLELLHRPPRPHPPHVHDARRAPVLVQEPVHKRRDLAAPPRLDDVGGHERHEDGRQHVVCDRARDEVGQHRAHGGRVQREVVDAPQRADEALEELLAPVHPRQPRQQHARHLPLRVLLLEGGDEHALDHLVPVPPLLQVTELLHRAPHLPRHEVLVDNLPHRRLELGDRQRELQLRRHLCDDLLAELVAGEGRDVFEDSLGDHLVLEKEGNGVRRIVDGVGRALLRVLHPLERRLQPRLDVGGLEGAPVDQRGEELRPQAPLRLGAVHGGGEDTLHELGPELGEPHLVDADGGVGAALALDVLLQDKGGGGVDALERRCLVLHAALGHRGEGCRGSS